MGADPESGGGQNPQKPDPKELVHCDPKVQAQIANMRAEARRTHGETGFTVQQKDGKNTVSDLKYSDLGTEVNQKIGPETIATFHMHLEMGPYPGSHDRAVARGETKEFRDKGAYGRTTVSYVSQATTLMLYNGANPKNANGSGDRLINAPPCSK